MLVCLLIGCVVSATMTCEHRHGCCDSWSDGTVDAKHVVVEAQNMSDVLETAVMKQNGIALCWTTMIGQVVDTRCLGEADKRD